MEAMDGSTSRSHYENLGLLDRLYTGDLTGLLSEVR
jgi:hypothetical protein